MLSRGNSEASTRLRRAKSTSSYKHHVPLKSESLDPETARQHAIAAASHAFERANERVAMSNTKLQEDKAVKLVRRKQTAGFHKHSPLHAQRFQGGRPRQTVNSTPRSSLPDPAPEPLVSLTDALHHIDNAQTIFEELLPSTPSSYRRLRKSKSVHSPGLHRDSSLRSQGIRQPTQNGGCQRSVSLKHSMSFLRGVSENLSRGHRPPDGQDEAVQIARDQYLQSLQQQRLRERPSFIFANKFQRQTKALRKTVRDCSNNTNGSGIASSDHCDDAKKSYGVGQKARIFSIQVRNKFQRVFRRSSQPAEQCPPQQLNASRLHFRDYSCKSPKVGIAPSVKDATSTSEELMSRFGSRTPSLHSIRSQEDPGSYLGNSHRNPSQDSSTRSKSRVTSWANSIATTASSRHMAAERKRLSIIQENGGPHQPSRSYAAHGTGYALFRKPLNSNIGMPRVNKLVDTKRLHSALLKEIKEGSGNSEQDEVARDSREENMMTKSPSTPIQRPKNSSTRMKRVGATIRRVVQTPAEEYMKPAGTPISTAVTATFVSYGETDNRVSQHKNHNHPMKGSKSAMQLNRKPSYPGDRLGLTPQQVANRYESRRNNSQRKPLREVRSAFFPFLSEISSAASSPYMVERRAQRENEQFWDDTESVIVKCLTVKEEPREQSDSTNSMYSEHTDNDSYRDSYKNLYRNPLKDLSRSADSAISLVVLDEDESSNCEPGVATILTSESTRYQHPPSTAHQPDVETERDEESLAAKEWQNWTASQLSLLDLKLGEKLSGRPVIVEGPRIGHRRERAEIVGDDSDIGPSGPSVNLNRQISRRGSIIASQEESRNAAPSSSPINPIPRPRTPMIDRFPLLGQKTRTSATIQRRPSYREISHITEYHALSDDASKILSSQDHHTLNSVCRRPSNFSVRSATSDGIYSHLVSNTIKVDLEPLGNANQEAGESEMPFETTSVTRKQSPERIARLRRIQSSRAPSTRKENVRQENDSTSRRENARFSTGPSLPKRLLSQQSPEMDPEVMGGKNMIDLFLSGRRRGMKISEESLKDTVFL
ncbi:MAG: hypothetical protein M1834_004485 [Cirrosporium novae-zelandiae]|nr:MAG: hypothetical protein M1834_004485 [Cirrosporium novae-zelandiae]